MNLTLKDIKDNLYFNDGGIPDEDIFEFLDKNIDNMKFTCIDKNVKYEERIFKEEELEDYSEELYKANIYIDDDGKFTLNDTDNTPIEINFIICNDKKACCIQYFD